MTPRDELQASWARTCTHLNAAFQVLPESPKDGLCGGSVAAYHDWLSHNELELALDELEMLADANVVPRKYWENLLAAAQEMKLDTHIQRYKERLPE